MLTNKTVLITGANGTLGRAASTAAAKLGARLILIDISSTCTFEVEAPYKYIQLDLTNSSAVTRSLKDELNIDVVFNIAGGFGMGTPVHGADNEQWEMLFELNVTTMRNVVKAVIPGMINRGKGSIVNIGALGATVGAANMGSYCASKSVVMRLTESMSSELKHLGINVNAVLPSVIDSAANRASMPNEDPSKWVSPEDLANVLCFLGSGNARAVHGALIPVSGLV